ncbi:potassium-transporting ATPase subunit KdpC [Ideonella sp. B7]|uniref:potassium-transporting ATPase subunit KdpC n=1 Tax=Ideonella benzenivorans TaxID=2831643 RepID=UPI002872F037|nr:potassium-transporting ATPase subunit KdpC [Ideonella benzenivorans]MCA6215473.1 potassium-transporting ATPase subunit KdpC [Ideonella benzenivorans]
MNTLTATPAAAPMSNAEGLWRPAVVLFAALSLVTGLAYPLAVTGVAQTALPAQANGSLIQRGGQAIGSRLIGQPFSDPAHFWGRPSATNPMPNNAANSGGSNLGPSNPALVDAVKGRIAALKAADPGQTAAVPVDLVTASASGLDPHISRVAADYQLPRIARLRGLPENALRALVEAHTERPWLGFLGEPRVNVLQLNLDLDASHPLPPRS